MLLGKLSFLNLNKTRNLSTFISLANVKIKKSSSKLSLLCEAVRPDLLSTPAMGFCPTSEAGLAKGRPTQPPELLGVKGGVGLPGTGL